MRRTETKVYEVQCLVPAVSDDLGAMLYSEVGWSKVNATVYLEILEHFMFPFGDQLYKHPGFLF